MEEQLNVAIAALFKLGEPAAEILTANLDFVRKVHIVQSAVNEQNASPDQAWLRKEIKDTFGTILGVNTERQVVAHSAFEPGGGGGVQFRRTVAKGQINRQDPFWDEAKFAREFETMKRLEASLANVLRHIQPYVATLDFSDPRNSIFIPLLT